MNRKRIKKDNSKPTGRPPIASTRVGFHVTVWNEYLDRFCLLPNKALFIRDAIKEKFDREESAENLD